MNSSTTNMLILIVIVAVIGCAVVAVSIDSTETPTGAITKDLAFEDIEIEEELKEVEEILKRS